MAFANLEWAVKNRKDLSFGPVVQSWALAIDRPKRASGNQLKEPLRTYWI